MMFAICCPIVRRVALVTAMRTAMRTAAMFAHIFPFLEKETHAKLLLLALFAITAFVQTTTL